MDKTDFNISDMTCSINEILTFEELPNPTIITIEKEFYVVTDGIFEVNFSYVGIFRIKFESELKNSKTITVTVNEN
jgi:hypothetical protein